MAEVLAMADRVLIAAENPPLRLLLGATEADDLSAQ